MLNLLTELRDALSNVIVKAQSRKFQGAVAAFVAAVHAGRPDLAVGAVVAYIVAEGYVDGKN